MANHKRKRPKSSRAGCLMCKPYKHQLVKGGYKAQTWQEKRAIISEREQRRET